uniref:Pentacotripeptide-repeat region of PRORP domain-containing protein n=1 Tax=Spongospora subterranea TaxID=70186 RepID=A0A0H5RBK2_9EUKA|eukprot:CRZ11403.1 hypothetical protein [Spongospora subterranea]
MVEATPPQARTNVKLRRSSNKFDSKMSVPTRLYRAILRACRRFDDAIPPKFIEPLLDTPAIVNAVGLQFFLSDESAEEVARNKFRSYPEMGLRASIDQGFSCLRALQQADNELHESVLAVDEDDDADDDQSDDSDSEHVDSGSAPDEENRGVRLLTVLKDSTPHFDHEPITLQDILYGSFSDTPSPSTNPSSSRPFEWDLQPSNDSYAYQLQMDLVKNLEQDDALGVQELVAELLKLDFRLIPRNAYAAIIDSCCSTLNTSLIFSLFQTFRNEGITISSLDLYPIFEHAAAYDDPSTAFAALNETRWSRRSSSPIATNSPVDDPFDYKSIHAVMWICGNCCSTDVVKGFLDVMVSKGALPTETTGLILMRSLCGNPVPQIDAALDLLRDLEARWNIKPTTQVFNMILFSYYNSNEYDFEDGLHILRLMESSNIVPNAETFQALLLCAGKFKRTDSQFSDQFESMLEMAKSAGFNINGLIKDIEIKLTPRWRA